MLFNSLTFAIFFIIVYGLYWALWKRYGLQNRLLLIASYVFYGWWDVRFLFLVVLSTFVDYWVTILISRGRLSTREKTTSSLYLILAAFFFVTVQWPHGAWTGVRVSDLIPADVRGWWVTLAAICAVILGNIVAAIPKRVGWTRPEKFYAALGILVNVAVLGVFKYFNFFVDSFTALWTFLFYADPGHLVTRLVLPVGISFFTFLTISHVVDVYRKKMPGPESLLDLGLYIAFFPQILAGPLTRSSQLLHQIQRPRGMTREDWREGLWLLAWGLYKKVVVADNVARLVSGVFEPYDKGLSVLPADGMKCLFAIYAFAIQIYCDFSGYTDMARGTARLLGFDLMRNFNLPYMALSPSDFWRRWHISLSTWLRDYLYIPLGGNRGGTLSTYRNLMVTMILGGLWHGASWTFVLWGAYHGALLVGYRVLGDRETESRLSPINLLKGLFVFHLMCFGWLLFRAHNLTTVWLFTKSMLMQMGGLTGAWELGRTLLFYSWFLVLFQIVQAWTRDLEPLKKWHWFVRLNVWILIVISLIRLAPVTSQEFIYFAF